MSKGLARLLVKDFGLSIVLADMFRIYLYCVRMYPPVYSFSSCSEPQHGP